MTEKLDTLHLAPVVIINNSLCENVVSIRHSRGPKRWRIKIVIQGATNPFRMEESDSVLWLLPGGEYHHFKDCRSGTINWTNVEGAPHVTHNLECPIVGYEYYHPEFDSALMDFTEIEMVLKEGCNAVPF